MHSSLQHDDIMSSELTFAPADGVLKQFGMPSSHAQMGESLPFNPAFDQFFFNNEQNQGGASDAPSGAHATFPAVSSSLMNQQQTKHMHNFADIHFLNAHPLTLLQEGCNYVAIDQSTSEAPSSSRKLWVASREVEVPSASTAPELYNNGSVGDEIQSRVIWNGQMNVPLYQLGSNIGMEGKMNGQNYSAVVSTASSNWRELFSLGHGASASGNSSFLHFQHGAQSSAGATPAPQVQKYIGSQNPDLPLAAAECWQNGDNKEDPGYTLMDAPGCSKAQMPSALPNNNTSHAGFSKSHKQKDCTSLINHQMNSNDEPAQPTADAAHPTGDRQASMQQHRKAQWSLDTSYLTAADQYASVGKCTLAGSKYLRAAQRLLEEVCNVKTAPAQATPQAPMMQAAAAEQQHRKTNTSRDEYDHPPLHHRHAPPPLKKKGPASSSATQPTCIISSLERWHLQMQKARLVCMVEELDRRYQRYHEQMQRIITSFESATGMGAAAPYTAPARKLMSRQFRALRDAIAEQIHRACSLLGEDISSVPVLNKGETPRLRILDEQLRHHRTLQQVCFWSQPSQLWRPHRGLPERSVAFLRAWLFEHFLDPYPKDSEKLMLARLTGLTKSQVTNWFINARVRLWKPMVEQMYAEERKEAESQRQAGAAQSISAYGSSSGSRGSNLMAHGNLRKRHHYQHPLDEECKRSRTSPSSNVTTMPGVSLTLALQHSSSVDIAPNTYNPADHHYFLHPGAEDTHYNVTDAFR